RDRTVTGVQTCALPISKSSASLLKDALRMKCCILVAASQMMMTVWSALTTGLPDGGAGQQAGAGGEPSSGNSTKPMSSRKIQERSEERRVGKEGRERWG